ncbi:hypothetical protein H5410_064123, partial [Solanum commersonii]
FFPFSYFSSLSSPYLTIVATTVEIKKNSSFVFFTPKEMSNLSISTYSDANVLCRCGVNAELKTSRTQLNTGRRIFCCKKTKRKGGCDYFRWYDDELPPQAKKIIWGLLKRIKSYEQERKWARKIRIICVIALVIFAIWKYLC